MDNPVATTRILLVEDEGLVRMLTAESLQDEGFNVVEATDGDEAVTLLNGENFDILLTDVQMPGSLDGIGVALHARRLHPELPVIVVSGFAPYLVARLTELDPAAVYIGKPYSLKQVVEAVRHLITSVS